jgi:prepilin-type N-terminal cleavage/methylation domain-containing protein
MITLNIFLKSKSTANIGNIRQDNDNTINSKKGFTLIELIVVIAIIGLLASVVITALGVSRARGEIARVLGDYKSVVNALELYRQSRGGQYPGNERVAQNMSQLIDNNGQLSEYIKQSPSVSPLVVEPSVIDGVSRIYYYLNPVGSTVGRYWCGDTTSDQDYVIYFEPTAQAIASGLFKTLYSAVDAEMSGYVCISVDQK